MSHDWVYHPIVGGRGIVKCRHCGKWDSYRLTGYKPQPPQSDCNPPAPRFLIVRLDGAARLDGNQE